MADEYAERRRRGEVPLAARGPYGPNGQRQRRSRRPWLRFALALSVVVLIGAAYAARPSTDEPYAALPSPRSPLGDHAADGEPTAERPMGPETVSENTTNPPQADLHDDLSCEVDSIGWVVARGTLTNRSSKTSAYLLHVSFNDAEGVRFAEGSAVHNDVRSGETVRWDTFPASRSPDDPWTCEIVSIERWASQ